MALSAREMGEAIIRNMKEKTGRSLEEWLAMIPPEMAGDKQRVVAWLKDTHGVGHYQAVTVFERSQGTSEYDDRAGIEAKLFGTTGEALAGGYRALEQEIMGLGTDVASIACRTYIPFKRRRQFAVIAPRGDILRLGLALGDEPFSPPFETAKGLGGSDRITHAVAIRPEETGAALPATVRDALRRAYETNG